MSEALAALPMPAGDPAPHSAPRVHEGIVLQTAVVDSPIGPLALYAHAGVLCGLAFNGGDPLKKSLGRRFAGVCFETVDDPAGAASALREYFAGRLTALDAIRVDPGGTSFQASIWAALRRIPPGSTASYGDIAREVGSPKAVRAVGLANGSNPIAIVIPCHRVVASNGTLHGYGGGLDRKEWLLRHEKASWREGGRRGA